MAVDEAGKARAELRRALADWLSLEFIIRAREALAVDRWDPGRNVAATHRGASLQVKDGAGARTGGWAAGRWLRVTRSPPSSPANPITMTSR